MTEISRLPGPVMDLWEWQYEGKCREAAKSICATCPVIEECREHSFAVREPYGVWGGLSEEERADLLSSRLRRAG